MLPYNNDFVSFYSLLAPSTLEDAMIIMCIANRFLFLYSLHRDGITNFYWRLPPDGIASIIVLEASSLYWAYIVLPLFVALAAGSLC